MTAVEIETRHERIVDDQLHHYVCCLNRIGRGMHIEPSLCGQLCDLTREAIVGHDEAQVICVVCDAEAQRIICPRSKARCPHGYNPGPPSR